MHPGEDGEASVDIGLAVLRLRDAVIETMKLIRQRVVQTFVMSSVVFLLLWVATFLYGSFYYSYMPKAAFSTPVHYHYRYLLRLVLLHQENIR